MASKHFVVLLLLVATATITGATIPITYPISNITDPKIQHMGSFAVEEYDKKGNPHLFFKEVYGGYVFFYPPSAGISYFLDLTAVNCSQSGALGNYTAEVFELWLNSTTTNYFFYGLKPKQS